MATGSGDRLPRGVLDDADWQGDSSILAGQIEIENRRDLGRWIPTGKVSKGREGQPGSEIR